MSRGHILILEDDLLVRLACTAALEEAGLTVVEAGDLASARHAIKANDFDLQVLTVDVPDGDGLDLCHEVRLSGYNGPILIQSGYDWSEKYLAAMRAGASDFLTKPYSDQQFVERVELLLGMPPIVRRSSRSSRSSGSNAPTAPAYALPVIASALAALQFIRPIPGSMPRHPKGEGENENKDVRLLPLNEPEAEALQASLEALRDLLAQAEPPQAEIDKHRAVLVGLVSSVGAWVGGRATVVTDELLKNSARIAVGVLVAKAMGLRLDLIHIVASLAGIGVVDH